MRTISFSKSRFHEYEDMKNWCVEQFGRGASAQLFKDVAKHKELKWASVEMFGNLKFSFRDEKGCAWFLLRWE